ncbi:hypothetical protein pb186bvf_005216 [Paramecium bursaria]
MHHDCKTSNIYITSLQTMNEVLDIEKLAQLIYEKRKQIYLKDAPKYLSMEFNNYKSFEQIEDCLKLMQQFSDGRKQFTLDLLVQISRGWQGFMKKQDGKYKYSVDRKIIGDCNLAYLKIFRYSCKQDLIIKDFTNNNVIQQIQDKLQANIKIVNQVINYELQEKNIVQYFNESKFFEFQGSVDDVLYGISSQDGKRVYISNKIEKFKNGIIYIEALIIDHLYQWICKSSGPGSSYLSQVYDIQEWYFSPFEVYMYKPYKYFSVLF